MPHLIRRPAEAAAPVTGRRAPRLVVPLAALLAALLSALGAVPAAATTPSTTRVCAGDRSPSVGEVRDEVLAGSLRVPRGVDCFVARTLVRGNLLVDPGGRVTFSDSTVEGDVLTSGSTDLDRSVVRGKVWLDHRDAWLQTRDAVVHGNVGGRAVGMRLDTLTVHGSINVTTTYEAGLRLVDVAGWVNLPVVGDGEVQVAWSTLRRGLTVKNGLEVQVCGSDVAEHLVVLGTRRELAVGHPTADVARFPACVEEAPPESSRHGLPDAEQDAVAVAGAVVLRGNTGSARLGHSTVGQDLVCTDNLTPITTPGTTVHGDRRHQCREG